MSDRKGEDDVVVKKNGLGYSMTSTSRAKRGVDKVIKDSHENDAELDRNANDNDPNQRYRLKKKDK